MKQEKTIMVVLAVLLVLAVVYIVSGKYQETKEQEQIAIFQQGAQAGVQQAIVQVMQQLSTCNQVPLFAGNVSINAVAVECLPAECFQR